MMLLKVDEIGYESKIVFKNKSCDTFNPMPFGFIIFGASGNLSNKKLLPSLFGLFKKNIIKNDFFILGIGRSKFNNHSFRKNFKDNIQSIFPHYDKKIINEFLKHIYYLTGNYENDVLYINLKKTIKTLKKKHNNLNNIVFNLATPPFLFEKIFIKLIQNQLLKRKNDSNNFERIMIEKPFGYDLTSAKQLNKIILKCINESQVFRVDHYLGKSTVQNILIFRFENSIFRNLWNNKYIDNVQIKFKEKEGIESRIDYFEPTGLIRDIFQNHILQLITLIAMDRPEKFTKEYICSEKIKILKKIIPFNYNMINEQILLGQYDDYHNINEKTRNSCTETFFVSKIYINSDQWKNVPFYVMAGKKMDIDESRITIVFKKNLNSLLSNNNFQNLITFNIKPCQGININFLAKIPGNKLCVKPINLSFNYSDISNEINIDDYESVILECLLGDNTIFIEKQFIDTSWQILDPLLSRLQACSIKEKRKMLHIYRSGTEGPKELYNFIKKDNKCWF